MNTPQGEDDAPPPKANDSPQRCEEGTTSSNQHGDREKIDQQDAKVNDRENPQVTSSTYRPVAVECPKIELPSHQINAQIQYMRDHALIGKFIGMWPTEKALHG